jgi:polysaccharide biosynthesis protein PslH
MKILYVTNCVQHPAMHSTFRHYYFLRELGLRHEVTLLTLTKAPVPFEVLAELRRHAAQVHVIDASRAPRRSGAPLLRPAAALARKARNALREAAALREMKRLFQQLVCAEHFDLVLLHGHNVHGVIDGWSGPVAIDICDATSELIRGRMQYAPLPARPLHWLRYVHTRRIERGMIARTSHVSFISCRDREAALGPDSRAPVIPNAVDADFWKAAGRNPEPATLVFHGAMDYRPNVDAALQLIHGVMPAVRAAHRGARLLIVGRDPVSSITDAASTFDDVIVTGRVDDVRPWLESAAIHVSPLRFGAGQQNKLLEAMSMEIPVITSANGASGLRVGPADPPVVVAEPLEPFVAAVLRLLDDPAERRHLGAAGRRYIAGHFTIADSVNALEVMCLAAARGAGLRPGVPLPRRAAVSA